MLLIIVCFLCGIGAGYALSGRKGALKWAGRITEGLVCLMLFVLGFSIGANDSVMRSLGSLGVEGLLLALGAMAGSVGAAAPLYFLVLRKRDEN
jgi:hypothetical protein